MSTHKPKPTIDELEEILAGTREQPVEILPSGEIVARAVYDRSRIAELELAERRLRVLEDARRDGTILIDTKGDMYWKLSAYSGSYRDKTLTELADFLLSQESERKAEDAEWRQMDRDAKDYQRALENAVEDSGLTQEERR